MSEGVVGQEGHPVVVVGAGPVGLVAALLLARHGVRVVAVEREAGPQDQPRAVHLDDEAVRVLQAAGVADAFVRLGRPARGLRLLDDGHRVRAEVDRTGEGPSGWPRATHFDHPDLAAVLREAVGGEPLVDVVAGVAVTGVVAHRDVVTVEYAEHGRAPTSAAAVLGCDGAHSVVREAIGAAWPQDGLHEDWLVVDLEVHDGADADRGHWEGVHHVCDPARASTFLRLGKRRYRFEAQVLPGETGDDLAGPEVLARLLAPWFGPLGVPSAGPPAEPSGPETLSGPGTPSWSGAPSWSVRRVAAYTARVSVADRWRAGRVLLVGDAAHVMPPYVGQGLGAGLRDAADVAWKLARVLEGAPEALLDTYQAEREPHVRAAIRLTRLAGAAVTGGGGRLAPVRRAAVLRAAAVPGLLPRLAAVGSPRLRVASPSGRRPSRARVLATVGVRAVAGRRDRLAGRLMPQPDVDVDVDGAGVRLDDLVGPRFAVLSRVPPDPALRDLAARWDALVLRVGGGLQDGGLQDDGLQDDGLQDDGLQDDGLQDDGLQDDGLQDDGVRDGGVLEEWLWAAGATAALVRPDRYVLASTRDRTAPGADLARRVQGWPLARVPDADVAPHAPTGRPATASTLRR